MTSVSAWMTISDRYEDDRQPLRIGSDTNRRLRACSCRDPAEPPRSPDSRITCGLHSGAQKVTARILVNGPIIPEREQAWCTIRERTRTPGKRRWVPEGLLVAQQKFGKPYSRHLPHRCFHHAGARTSGTVAAPAMESHSEMQLAGYGEFSPKH